MNKSQAKTYLRSYIKLGFKTTIHCRDRMVEREVTVDDILNVVNWGEVAELENEESGQWKCTVKGFDIEGDELVFVAILDEFEKSVLCITVF